MDAFTETVVKELRRQMNDLADFLASNRSSSMEDYRYTCGVIRGLAIAEEYVIDLAKKIEEQE